ncbi:hypothetical protein LINGRAHAP2_LOCUS30551 [Linum grandiflorum]
MALFYPTLVYNMVRHNVRPSSVGGIGSTRYGRCYLNQF